MSDTLASMGKLHDHDLGRDAVHVAVISCTTVEAMNPGTLVTIEYGNHARRCAIAKNAVGIIDPFFDKVNGSKVPRGARVWVFLFPNTITGLTHKWSHPVIDNLQRPDPSMKWIEKFAREISQRPEALIEAAIDYHKRGQWTHDNSESYKGTSSAHWQIFWRHYELITGEEVDVKSHDECPYTCSC